MNSTFRKTTLIVGLCTVVGLAYTPQAYAAGGNNEVASVQQTKKIPGRVSDSMGPLIGATVMEKGTSKSSICFSSRLVVTLHLILNYF